MSTMIKGLQEMGEIYMTKAERAAHVARIRANFALEGMRPTS